MEGGGIDISNLIKNLLQGVPVWGIIIAALGYWLHRQKDFLKKEEERWDRIEKRIYNMELLLASSGIGDIKGKIEEFKAFQITTEANMKAIWRAIEAPKRSSDRHD